MIALQSLTDEGIIRFREYLHDLKSRPSVSRPDLDSFTEVAPLHEYVEIDETMTFATRLELAEYLSQTFQRAGLARRDVIGHLTMWTWLAYIWFDDICPVIDGSRKVLEDARYICSSGYRDYYRHFIAAPYDIYSIHGQENSRLFLKCPHNANKDMVEQLASRQFIISNTRLISLANALYWDNTTGTYKRGCTNRNRPGNIRRFTKLIDQLELTYDVHIMEPEKTIKLLPNEFNEWMDQ